MNQENEERETSVWAGKGSLLSGEMMGQQIWERRGSPLSSEGQGDREGAGLRIRNHHQ